MRPRVIESGMEKVVQKRSLADFRKNRGTSRKNNQSGMPGRQAEPFAENVAAMSFICRTRTEDGRVERRFRRVRKTA